VPTHFQPYWSYAGLDAILTFRLWEALEERVTDTIRPIIELEHLSTWTLTEMEWRGTPIDVPFTEQTHRQLGEWEASFEAWFKETYGFRPGEKRKLADYLMREGVHLTEETPGGDWAMTREVLEGIAHPVAEQVVTYRRGQKIRSTYTGNLLERHRDGIVRCDIKPLGTRTGRMSIVQPALQTLPRADVSNPFSILVRDCFRAREGNTFLLIDYDQIEMRLLAHFSGDAEMIRRIEHGDELTALGHTGFDVHSMNARAIYDIPLEEKVPREKRQLTKNAGFAKAYGAGLDKFCATAGVAIEDGRRFLDMYDQTFPGVRRFQNEVQKVAELRARDTGLAWVNSPYGRRHPCEPYQAYKLINYLIQGTAADVLKAALVELHSAGLIDYMCLPVHDEVIFEVPQEDAEEISMLATEIMTERTRFAVPLTADLEIVERWGDKYR
jgi:DNA polymerase-1